MLDKFGHSVKKGDFVTYLHYGYYKVINVLDGYQQLYVKSIIDKRLYGYISSETCEVIDTKNPPIEITMYILSHD